MEIRLADQGGRVQEVENGCPGNERLFERETVPFKDSIDHK